MVVDRNNQQRSIPRGTIRNRHSASSDQLMKTLMSLREGLHVMVQCDMRQHLADRNWLYEHPGGHASWERNRDEKNHKRIDHVLRARTCVKMETFRKCNQYPLSMCVKQRVSSQTVWKIKISLESCFDAHGEEAW